MSSNNRVEIVLPGVVEPEHLELRESTMPTPGPGQALIRMEATGVSFADHVGGPGIVTSWRLLRHGGTLVSYGTAATRDDSGNRQLPVLKLLGRLWLWNALPNRRRAFFSNVWAGRSMNTARFQRRLRADLGAVFAALPAGRIDAPVAAELPLARAAEAMRLAESGTVSGKVILTA